MMGLLGGFSLSLLLQGACAATVPEDAVTHLPGYDKPLQNHFAGHVEVDASRRANLFYWFCGSQRDVQKDPIVVWFQGGGGASPPWGAQTGPFAMQAFAGGGPSTFGLFNELGPFLPPSNSSGKWLLRDRPYSWNDKVSMLFIDQPAGVGFSYFENFDDGYVEDMAQVGHDSHVALHRILTELHPEFAKNDLFIFGESYAGHYVPSIAYDILTHPIKSKNGASLNLVGVGLGDVCPGEENTIALNDLLLGLGYVDSIQHSQMGTLRRRCVYDLSKGDFKAAFASCEGMEIAKNLFSGGIYDEDSRLYANYSSLSELVNVDAATSQDRDALLTNVWLDLPQTRRALNVHKIVPAGRSLVRDGNQRNCTRGLWEGYDNVRSTLRLWPTLVSRLRLLVYNGNFDVSCNHLGASRYLQRLGQHFATAAAAEAYSKAWAAMERRYFTINGTMAGYWRHVHVQPLAKGGGERGSAADGSGGSVTIVVGQGGGHLYPHDQPHRMRVLLDRFIFDTTTASAAALCDQVEPPCRASDVAMEKLGSRCALMYNCSGHGTCTDEAACICHEGWFGTDCAFERTPLTSRVRTQARSDAGKGNKSQPQPQLILDNSYELGGGAWRYHSASVADSSGLILRANSSGVCVFVAVSGTGKEQAQVPTATEYTASWCLPAAKSVRLDVYHSVLPFVDAAGKGSIGCTIGVTNTADTYDAKNVRYTIGLE